MTRQRRNAITLAALALAAAVWSAVELWTTARIGGT